MPAKPTAKTGIYSTKAIHISLSRAIEIAESAKGLTPRCGDLKIQERKMEPLPLRLRFLIQWSQVKKDFYCAQCRQHSGSRDYNKMVINHKSDCRYIALLQEMK
jgi:hypothetical protein